MLEKLAYNFNLVPTVLTFYTKQDQARHQSALPKDQLTEVLVICNYHTPFGICQINYLFICHLAVVIRNPLDIMPFTAKIIDNGFLYVYISQEIDNAPMPPVLGSL
jgi:hypothetical protein